MSSTIPERNSTAATTSSEVSVVSTSRSPTLEVTTTRTVTPSTVRAVTTSSENLCVVVRAIPRAPKPGGKISTS